MITDRDIVINASRLVTIQTLTTVGELAQGSIDNVDANASVADMLTIMEAYQVRRLPVVDQHRLIGIVSEADIVQHLPQHAIADFVQAICAPAASGSRPSLTGRAGVGGSQWTRRRHRRSETDAQLGGGSPERGCRASQGVLVHHYPDEEVWGVEITTPDGGFESEVCDTLEEAKQYCERARR